MTRSGGRASPRLYEMFNGAIESSLTIQITSRVAAVGSGPQLRSGAPLKKAKRETATTLRSPEVRAFTNGLSAAPSKWGCPKVNPVWTTATMG